MAGPPKLIVLSEQLRGQSFELVEDQYTIGRSEECDICIPDPTVSSLHCTLVRDPDGTYRVVDNGSTNGTRINGVRVEEQKLVNSDIVQVGGVELLYDSEHKSATSVLSTQTGINLEDTAGNLDIQELENFSPFGSDSGLHRAENRKVFMFFVIGLAVLGAAALVMLVIVLRKLFTG